MILFNSIKWRNFLSTGNQFIEIKLDKHPSTLIIGENSAGKSTILDALCFCLFGKAFRNINKPQLVNSINQKNCLVETEFTIGKRHYKITRGMKPGIFEIHQDNNLLSQDAAIRDYQKYLEDKILKLNYKSFTQIVILGSASFTPFMQLPQGSRREVIEDILDIQIFSVMNNILKTRIITQKDLIKEAENKIELSKQKAKLQQDYIEQLEQNQKKRNESINESIEKQLIEIKEITENTNVLTEEYNNLRQLVEHENKIQNNKIRMVDIYKSLQLKLKKLNEEINFYNNNDSCPTCKQNISTELKTNTINTHTSTKDEIVTAIEQLYDKIKIKEEQLNDIITIKIKIVEVQRKITEENGKIIARQNYIKKLQNEIVEKTDEKENIDAAKQKLREIALEGIEVSKSKIKLREESFYLEAAATLLKDTGIKTKVIKQYLPVINKLVNKYLSVMDFFVSFELDESFNEIIKSRFRDEFSYYSFSEGEKQRIDLALLFTWRTIAKMKNSVATNLLLLDEIFDSSLDANGTECVMQLLNTIGEETNVFVISHKGDQLQDKFSNVIKVEKHQNFSQLC